MTEFEIEYHIARIVAGGPTFTARGGRYFVVGPGRHARLEAAVVQREALRDAVFEGVPTRDELEAVLVERGIWSGERQARLEALTAEVEALKIALYNGRNEVAATQLNRELLRKASEELDGLRSAKHQLDQYSAETLARAARARYLAGASLLRSDGTPYWADRDRGWAEPDDVLEAALAAMARDHLDTGRLRWLARCDQWTALWNNRKDGLLGPAVDLTDEQGTLVSWSAAYENIAQVPGMERSTLEDDDMLDGWMLLQRQKKAGDDLESQFNSQISEKVRGKDEVFVMMDPDARQGSLKSSPAVLNSLNDEQARRKKNQRQAYLKKEGIVAEQDMPDTRLENLMASVKAK